MFYKISKPKQQLNYEQCFIILNKATNGTLALIGKDGYPYAVPMSYVYYKNKIYFHCGKKGHKIDCIKDSNKASFCVVNKDNIVPEKLTTEYESVIVFGEIKFIEDKNIKVDILKLLSKKYSPHISEENLNLEIDKFIEATEVLELSCDSITGKKSE